jgi:pyroglutamyl-peptidase
LTGRPLRILITGFGSFPGAPYNPTPDIVARLLKLRRPALADAERIGHVFPVTYQAVDREFPDLLQRHRPDALLMFGLAARTPYLRIETRARNAVTLLWPDALGGLRGGGVIAPGAAPMNFGPHTLRLLRAAQATGIDARASRDAGRYLCNYLCWRALEAVHDGGIPRLAAFVHVPSVPHGRATQRRGSSRPPTLEHVVDAGEAMLLQILALTRKN